MNSVPVGQTKGFHLELGSTCSFDLGGKKSDELISVDGLTGDHLKLGLCQWQVTLPMVSTGTANPKQPEDLPCHQERCDHAHLDL